MRLPTPLLLDLAAGRDPGPIELDADVLALATEHRMSGLLWSWARGHLRDRQLAMELAMKDLAVQAHLERLWVALETTVAKLDAQGIEVVTVKGVTAEARWYGRRGERLCSDVDLWLDPNQLDRAGEAVAALQPEHPWVPHLDRLVASGRVQGVTIWVGDQDIDLHFDLLKLGIPTRGLKTLWSRTTPFPLPGGNAVRVLDDTAALLHFLVHLNKDRFQRLLGFADVVRLIEAGKIDWHLLQTDARREGIDVAVFRTLEVVLETLDLPWPLEVARPRGLRVVAWNRLWHAGIRLRGREGRLRFRMRQNWLAVLARGRSREALWWWLRELWPSAAAVDVQYADIRGPYIWKLLYGRTEAAITQHRRIDGIRRQLAASGTTDRTSLRPSATPPRRTRAIGYLLRRRSDAQSHLDPSADKE